MCEFCENIEIGVPDDFHEKNGGLGIVLRNVLDHPAIVFTNCGNEKGYGRLSVSFWPMCGRRLENAKSV